MKNLDEQVVANYQEMFNIINKLNKKYAKIDVKPNGVVQCWNEIGKIQCSASVDYVINKFKE